MQTSLKPAKKSKRAKLLSWFCLLAFFCSAATVLFYTYLPARTTFYADTSDTLYWAAASYDSGKVFSQQFHYATLQPFGGSLLMLPFVAVLGFGLKAHLLGMVLFVCIFMAGLWFFCTSLKISTNRRLLLFSAVLMLLSGSPKLRELMWEHVIYYSLGILFSLVLFGLCFRLFAAFASDAQPFKNKKTWVFMLLLFLLCVGIGTDGMQVLVLCTLPLAAAILAERFFDVKTHFASRKNFFAIILVGTMALGTGLGLFILRIFSRGIKTGYTQQHMVFSPSEQWGQNLLILPDFWARLLGFSPQNGQNIVSLASVPQLLRLLLCAILLVVPIFAAANLGKIKNIQLRIIIWFHLFLSGILLMSHLVGSTANANWRLTPAVFSSAVVTVLFMFYILQTKSAWRLCSLLFASLGLVCIINMASMLGTPLRNGQNQHFYALAHTLQQNGLSYGYADFQLSQPLTVLSNNKVKTRYVYMDENGLAPFYYQTETGWYNDVPGLKQYFLVMDKESYAKFLDKQAWQFIDDILIKTLDSGPYKILVLGQNPVKQT